MVDFAKLLKNRREPDDPARERAEEAADAAQDAAEGRIYLSALEDPEDYTPLAEIEATPDSTPIPEVLDTDLNFLTGPAGTGKTWLAKSLVAQRPGVLLCATTGIASINLGEGTTINAALKYFDTASLEESYVSGALSANLGKLYRAGIRRIVLDEISMLDAKQLTIITRALEEVAGKKYTMNQALADEVAATQLEEGEDPQVVLPIKLTLTGDFCQLPPVKAPFAFESPEWARFADHTHTLTEVRRQVDRDFILAIQAARKGDGDTVVEYFASRLHDETDHSFPGPTILATNEAVERFNQLRMDTVPAKLQKIPSTRWGKPRGDWKNIPEQLGLKVGALVMLLANRREPVDPEAIGRAAIPKLIYANGDLATVESIEPVGSGDGQYLRVWVTLQRTGEIHEAEWITRANLIPLEPGRVSQLIREGHEDRIQRDARGKARFEIVGAVTYCPLRIAYASTVHKCQGLSMDHVQINTREGFFKHPGMIYVALSRARTAEGLRLIGSVDGLRQRCTVDARVVEYL